MMGHTCEVCSQDVGLHESRCDVGEPLKVEHPAYVSEGGISHGPSVDWHPTHDHLPPLCCPGCPCRSFEEAHPETIGTPVAESGLDKRVLKILGYHQVLTMEELAQQRYLVGSWHGIGFRRTLQIWRAIRDFEKEKVDGAVQ